MIISPLVSPEPRQMNSLPSGGLVPFRQGMAQRIRSRHLVPKGKEEEERYERRGKDRRRERERRNEGAEEGTTASASILETLRALPGLGANLSSLATTLSLPTTSFFPPTSFSPFLFLSPSSFLSSLLLLFFLGPKGWEIPFLS